MRPYPEFRYHPNPWRTGAFVDREVVCTVCREKTPTVYVGTTYCLEEPELCPWCIASGEAARSLGATFVNLEERALGPSDESLQELVERTPCYLSAVEDEWPSCCGEFCAIWGEPSWEELEPVLSQLNDDLQHLEVKFERPREDLLQELRETFSPLTPFLFHCLSCRAPRLVGNYRA